MERAAHCHRQTRATPGSADQPAPRRVVGGGHQQALAFEDQVAGSRVPDGRAFSSSTADCAGARVEDVDAVKLLHTHTTEDVAAGPAPRPARTRVLWRGDVAEAFRRRLGCATLPLVPRWCRRSRRPARARNRTFQRRATSVLGNPPSKPTVFSALPVKKATAAPSGEKAGRTPPRPGNLLDSAARQSALMEGRSGLPTQAHDDPPAVRRHAERRGWDWTRSRTGWCGGSTTLSRTGSGGLSRRRSDEVLHRTTRPRRNTLAPRPNTASSAIASMPPRCSHQLPP